MRAAKVLVSGLGIPEVQGEVKMSAGGILQELRAPKAGIAQEESNPVAVRVVDSFKAFLTFRLDFKLPEDYKHSVPSSALAEQQSRITSKGKAGLPGV